MFAMLNRALAEKKHKKKRWKTSTSMVVWKRGMFEF